MPTGGATMAAPQSEEGPLGPAQRPRIVGLALFVLFAAGCDYVERASVNTAGGDPNGGSVDSSISADGRYVTFWSSADNLVPGDNDHVNDVFVRDLLSNTTTSADGRHVVFGSPASALVPGDGNHVEDVFVRDLDARTTTRASVDMTNGDPNGASGSAGQFSPPAIDADGSRVVFFSDASDLVPMDGNALSDMFVRDLSAGTTTRVSVDTGGGDANGPSDAGGGRPAITGDGNIIAFCSFASDLATGDINGTG